MAFKSAPYYWLECDNCGRKSTEYADHSAWADESYAVDDAEGNADWRIKDGRHFCTQCDPSWCMECENDITETNPRCGDDVWSCGSCHTDCEHGKDTTNE